MREEENYRHIRKILKSLPRVKAPKDFEFKLFQRIRKTESERHLSPSLRKFRETKGKGWIFNIFRPAFAPAVALTVVFFLIIILYLYFNSVYKQQTETLESQRISRTEQKEFEIKEPKERIIAKDESFGKIEGSTGEELESRKYEFESSKSDFTAPSPVESKDSEPLFEQKIESVPLKLEKETPVDEIKTEDLKNVERKEAPEIRKKGDVEKELKRSNEETIMPKEYNQSVIEGDKGVIDTSGIDSTKLKKKIEKEDSTGLGKIDTLKSPAEKQDKEQQDSIKK